jgi:hypothetical protein
MNNVAAEDLLIAQPTEREHRPPRRSFAKGFIIGAVLSSGLWTLIIWAVTTVL